MGSTSIHGIAARDVLSAPRFEEIAGDLLDRIHGCVLVAHNAVFDSIFLHGEFERLGVQLPALPFVCTMNMARSIGRKSLSADLEGCCVALGITHSTPHRALSDAQATAELFRLLVDRIFSGEPIDLDELNCRGKIPWRINGESLKRSGRIWKREHAETENTGPCHHLAKLVYRLAGMIRLDEVKPELAQYLDVLAGVLEDRMLTPEEAESLFETAALCQLRPEEVVEAHRSYVRRLAIAALLDGVISDGEMRDLKSVNDLFGFEVSFLLAAIQDAQASRNLRANRTSSESLAGKTVCFTGEFACTIQGEYISREKASELAADAGLSVKNNVTKKLDLLVVADSHTQSGKAKKAREYGVRILHEPVFWQMIGVKVD